jgi:hypothetical protein
VLFEIATDQPGFTIDQPLAGSGMALAACLPRATPQELEAVLPSLELAA